MQKSDLMRALIKGMFRKKTHSLKLSSDEKQENQESEDHIFKSNQSFQLVRKKIVRKKD
jgi:hypothetical protein